MYGLTGREKKVLDFLKSHGDDVAPSVQEMSIACGMKSKSQVHEVLKSLKHKGRIDWLPYTRRSIRVLDKKTPAIEIQKRSISECIAVLESKPKCAIAVIELKKMLMRIELEQEVLK